MTATFRLHAVPTVNSQRVALALEELGLAYTVHLVDRAANEQHGAAFRALNPAGMAPVLVDPDGPDGQPVTVCQSGAILLYLAEKTGQLLPADGAQRLAVLQWLMHVLTDVNATTTTLFFARAKVAPPHDATVALFEQRLLTLLKDLCVPLERNTYLAGELSIADLALYPLVATRGALLQPTPALAPLAAWAQRMAERPAVTRGMAAIV